MSEPSPVVAAGGGSLPPAVSFDPSTTRASELKLELTGAVVLLLVATHDSQWAAESAIELCTAWARGGRRVVLADLYLDDPLLHEEVGLPNLEGMVDLFLYGTSITRSALPVHGRGFYLIPAGTYEPDAESIYWHRRWSKLVSGFREAHASLVLFAPLASVDLAAMSRWATQVVVLGDPEDPAVLTPLLKSKASFLAHLTPPGAQPTAEPVTDAVPAAEEDLEEPGVAAVPAPQEELADEGDFDIEPVPEDEQVVLRSRGVTLLLVLLGAALVAAAGFLVARYQPELLPWNGSAPAVGPDSVVAAESAPPTAPTRAGDELPYSVQVKAFNSYPAAREEMLRQQARFASVPFYIVPEEVQGMLYYKILAGVSADTAVAGRLRDRLVESGAVDADDAAGAWSLIQHTPLAFDLGEFASQEEAAARADSLRSLQVPSYTVVMPYTDGTRRWQIYSGAFRNSASAEALRQQLRQAEIEPRLVLRLGEPLPDAEAE